MTHNRFQQGFTLPELIITLGIIAIVLSMAVPGVSNMIKDNRLVSHLNTVVRDIHLARGESVKRGVRVILCRSASPNQNNPTCGGNDYNWSTGYLVFADDGNYTNNVYDAGADTLLKRGQPSNAMVNVRTNAVWNRNLEFNPDGSTNEGGEGRMSFCDDRNEASGKQIRVAGNGLPMLFSGNIGDCTPAD